MEELGPEMLHAMGGHEDEDEKHNRGTDDLDDDDDHHHHKSDRPSGRGDDDDCDCGCNCYGACTNTAAVVLALGDAVPFSAEGVETEHCVDTPDPGHHSFKIKKTGQYLFNFMVNGAPATLGAPLVFGLTEDGIILAPTMAAGIGLVIGSGIVTLKKGKRVKLVNNSVSPAGGIATLSLLPGGAANASLSLTRVGSKC